MVEVPAVAAARANGVEATHRLVAKHTPKKINVESDVDETSIVGKNRETTNSLACCRNLTDRNNSCPENSKGASTYRVKADRHFEHHAASLPPTTGFLHFPQLAYTCHEVNKKKGSRHH